MKKYFEYHFDEKVEKKLIDFYNKPSKMHGGHHKSKMRLKLDRAFENIEISKEDTVLDVGCSEGELLKELSDKITYGCGFDLSENLIENNIKENKCYNIHYKVFDGVHISTDKKFDKIFLLDVLEHAFKPDTLIESIYNVLEDNGKFIIQVPSTGWLSELIFGKYHMGHLRYYDSAYLSNYLIDFNFKVEYVKVHNSVPLSAYFIRHKKIYRLLDFLCNKIPYKLYPYYGSIMIIASKNRIKGQ